MMVQLIALESIDPPRASPGHLISLFSPVDLIYLAKSANAEHLFHDHGNSGGSWHHLVSAIMKPPALPGGHALGCAWR